MPQPISTIPPVLSAWAGVAKSRATLAAVVARKASTRATIRSERHRGDRGGGQLGEGDRARRSRRRGELGDEDDADPGGDCEGDPDERPAHSDAVLGDPERDIEREPDQQRVRRDGAGQHEAEQGDEGEAQTVDARAALQQPVALLGDQVHRSRGRGVGVSSRSARSRCHGFTRWHANGGCHAGPAGYNSGVQSPQGTATEGMARERRHIRYPGDEGRDRVATLVPFRGPLGQVRSRRNSAPTSASSMRNASCPNGDEMTTGTSPSMLPVR